MTADRKGPLAGVRVIDLSMVMSGPLATALLAEQGADVVKVEPPGRGDLVRGVGTHRGGVTAQFALANGGKRSLALDIRRPEGLAVLHRLVAGADVLVQNFRPGVADRLGVGPAAMLDLRPELVYVSIAGLGTTGPLADMKVYDGLVQAMSGMMAVQGRDGAPACIEQVACDKAVALYTAQAVTAALFARTRGAGGQHVSVSMLDAAIAFLWSDAGAPATFIGDGATVIRNNTGAHWLTRHSDGYSFAAPVADDEWRGWCTAFGAPEVAADPRFATFAQRLTDPELPEIRRRIQRMVERVPTREAVAELRALGVPAVGVLTVAEVADHPQVRANGSFAELDHPRGGRMRVPAPVARFSATPARVGAPAPALGEDAAGILAEAGLDEAELAALRESGALG